MLESEPPGSGLHCAIEFRQVTKRYPGAEVFAIDQLSYQVPTGNLVVFLGPSGCGKTTLLKMVNRLIEPTSGQIFVNDLEIHDIPATELRRKIGYVIQQTGLFPHMTVRENVGVVPQLMGWDREKIQERTQFLMEMVRLPQAYLTRHPRQLSGGEQQRVGLARALAADPPILLMDEPFAAVDAITRLRLQDELRAIHQQLGKTILFVTHDVDEAFRLADQVVVMRAGKIVQHGSPLEILRNPKDEFVRELTGAGNLVRQLGLISVQSVIDQALYGRGGDFKLQDQVESFPSVTPQDNLRTVLSRLLSSPAESVVVLDGASNPVGKLGFEDLRRALANHDSTGNHDLPVE